jgi:hypothetical protein
MSQQVRSCPDCPEAALLLPHELEDTDVSDYKEKVVLPSLPPADAIWATEARDKAAPAAWLTTS